MFGVRAVSREGSWGVEARQIMDACAVPSSVAPVAHSSNWGDWYNDHADFVWRCLRRMGLAHDDAKDALHDVFLVVHRRLSSYDSSRSCQRAWLLGIAVNVVRAERRRHRPIPVEGLESVAAAEGTDHGATGEASRRSSQANGDVQQRGLAVALTRALESLDPERRVVFSMFELEGMGCTEIATELSIPVGTVYSRLHSARSQLQAALVEYRQNDGRAKS